YFLGWSIMFLFFFFSSRRRHPRFSRDWSSDVCSSDLEFLEVIGEEAAEDPLAVPEPAEAEAPKEAAAVDRPQEGVAAGAGRAAGPPAAPSRDELVLEKGKAPKPAIGLE